MNIEQRIRRLAAKKVKVIITGKTRNRDGFCVKCPNEAMGHHARTRKEALQMLLAKLRCADELVFRIEPVRIIPNPKHNATLSRWGRKVL